MSTELEDKVVIVTGAAGGIGEGYARAVSEAGARVVAADLDEAGAERVAAAIRKAGGDAAALHVATSFPTTPVRRWRKPRWPPTGASTASSTTLRSSAASSTNPCCTATSTTT